MMIRSIKISEETYQGIIARMNARETFDHVIQRLLQDTARRPRQRKRDVLSPPGCTKVT